jgi:hypothetical protein
LEVLGMRRIPSQGIDRPGAGTGTEAGAQAVLQVHESRELPVREREHIGYFEEFLADPVGDAWPKGLGARIFTTDLPPDQTGRLLGVAGKRALVLTEPLVLNKGHRSVTVNASTRRPVRVTTMLQMIEGREA